MFLLLSFSFMFVIYSMVQCCKFKPCTWEKNVVGMEDISQVIQISFWPEHSIISFLPMFSDFQKNNLPNFVDEYESIILWWFKHISSIFQPFSIICGMNSLYIHQHWTHFWTTCHYVAIHHRMSLRCKHNTDGIYLPKLTLEENL